MQSVVTATIDITLSDAQNLLAQHDLSCLPITDECGKLLGIVSHTEFSLVAKSFDAQERASGADAFQLSDFLQQLPIRHIIRSNIKPVAPTDTIQHAATIMLNDNIDSIPVIEDDKIVGIITKKSLTDYFNTL